MDLESLREAAEQGDGLARLALADTLDEAGEHDRARFERWLFRTGGRAEHPCETWLSLYAESMRARLAGQWFWWSDVKDNYGKPSVVGGLAMLTPGLTSYTYGGYNSIREAEDDLYGAVLAAGWDSPLVMAIPTLREGEK